MLSTFVTGSIASIVALALPFILFAGVATASEVKCGDNEKYRNSGCQPI